MSCVDLVVLVADLQRQLGVLAHEGVEAWRSMPWAMAAMRGRSISGLSCGSRAQLDGALADVLGHVAGALEVGGDLQRRGDQAQVARRRLVQGQQAQAQVVDLHVHAIDGLVALDDQPRELVVALDQRAHGVGDLLLDQAAHLQDHGGAAPAAPPRSVGRCVHASPCAAPPPQPNRPVM